MTSYFWDTPPARSRPATFAIRLGAVADAAIRPMIALREALRNRHNARLLEALPPEIRKDIGYRSEADGATR